VSLLELIGLAPTERDQRLRKLVSNSYTSVKVVGRGTVKIDPQEVSASDEFRQARREARMIVNP
jgi:hypothetical protein